MRLGFITGALVLFLDQLSKVWIVQWLDLKTLKTIEVAPPFLVFKMGWNRGINFGLFSGDNASNQWILIGLAVLVVGLVLFWVRSDPNPKVHISTGLLVGGALGNVIDRAVYGAVADFLNMSCCGISNPFSFNIADIAIFLGAVGLVIWASDKKAA